jgi:hypothetical protein
MHRLRTKAGTIMAAIVVSVECAFASDVPPCPSQIKVEQTVLDAPAGWSVHNTRSLHPFVNVRFSDGDPSQLVTLAPSRQKKRKGTPVDVWDFAAPSSEGYWISCVYAETSVVVVRQLPADVTSCEVEYDKAFTSPIAKHFTCR